MNYDSATDVLNTLYTHGYTADFSLMDKRDCIYCHSSNQSLKADEFIIDKIFRFEVENNADEEMMIYAVASPNYKLKGILIVTNRVIENSTQSKVVEKLKNYEQGNTKPIKRSNLLIALSREHHHSLLLSWKIKEGLSKKVDTDRIYKYLQWFADTHLLKQFDREEQYVFPLLSEEHRNKALEQHRHLKQLMSAGRKDEQTLITFHTLLTEHIRWEERELFNEAQKNKEIRKLDGIEVLQKKQKFEDNESDVFWV